MINVLCVVMCVGMLISTVYVNIQTMRAFTIIIEETAKLETEFEGRFEDLSKRICRLEKNDVNIWISDNNNLDFPDSHK